MGLEIANIESFTKYANKMPQLRPVGEHLNKLHDRNPMFDSFVKSLTKSKVQIPSDVINSVAKTFKPDAFCKIAQGSPRPFISKMNLNELFTKAMKFAKLIK